jgi:lon-related putative ATP-dependent protease
VAHRLRPDDLRSVCDPATLGFSSTADLAPIDDMIGQARAVSATGFGIAMRREGYNLFVLGPPRTGKTTAMRRALARAAQDEPTPSDFCYVHNFADAYCPVALELPPGRGRALRDEMARLVEECRTRLPRAFEAEEFERQRSRILEEMGERQRAEMERLEGEARAEGFVILRTPGGLGVAPAPRGEPLTPAQFEALPDSAKQRIAERSRVIEERLEATVRLLRNIERDTRARHEQLVSAVAAGAIRELIRELRECFAGLAAVQRYLDQVEADLVAHAEEFRHLESEKPAIPLMPPPGAFLDRYRVNVLVDRSGLRGAPVVFEEHPTHPNLMGRVEHRVHLGTLLTDFTLIRAGALHQANGGYLILEALDVLRNPFNWEALKRALRTRSIRLEDPLEEWRLGSTMGLAPEPIPLSVKVVLIGSPLIYYLLYALDEDFGELFKVKVDFDDSLPRTPEYEQLVARFIGQTCREEELRPFAADGVARLLEHSSRLVSDQGRLTSRLGELLDTIREASFWADQRGHGLVSGDDVAHAVAQRLYRANLIEERVGRLITEGTLLIDTDGERVGQVNGISVIALGDHAFGRPARITARVFSGEPGVLDIEREAKLGGPIHSKGVMILTGFLAGRYARERPLALSASLTFEQQYEEVEGDSASSAELYALLSSITGIPLAQHLAVTGSVNQQGEIQPVGGINEKIEGFFDACRARGLTGRQGVLIPEANRRHLMLRDDVVEAVRADRFHIHAIRTVDEGVALLAGRPAGERGPDGQYPAGSVNAAVEEALAASLARLKELRAK